MGTNDAGGDSDDVSNLAVVGAGAAGAAESEGDGDSVAGEPQLELRASGPVEGEGGVEGNRASQKHMRTDNYVMSSLRRVVTKVN